MATHAILFRSANNTVAATQQHSPGVFFLVSNGAGKQYEARVEAIGSYHYLHVNLMQAQHWRKARFACADCLIAVTKVALLMCEFLHYRSACGKAGAFLHPPEDLSRQEEWWTKQVTAVTGVDGMG